MAVPKSVPSARYFAAFDLFYDGEYREALKVFEEESRGAIRTPRRAMDRLDLLSHDARGMRYALGLLDKRAGTLYGSDRALFELSGLPDACTVPQTVGPATAQKYRAYPWGPSSRRSQPGHFPSEMLIGQGRLNNIDVLRQRGVVQYPVLLPIRVQEIVRTLSWAIRRRTELLGPLTPHDPLTSKLPRFSAAAPHRRITGPRAMDRYSPRGTALIAAGKAPGSHSLAESLAGRGRPVRSSRLRDWPSWNWAGWPWPAATWTAAITPVS